MQMHQDRQHFGGDAGFEDDEVNHNDGAEPEAAGLPDRDVVELAESDNEHEAPIVHLETNSNTVEPWTPYDGSRESWDNLEYLTSGMPTTRNVVTSTPDFQDPNVQEDLGLYLGLDLGIHNEERFYA